MNDIMTEKLAGSGIFELPPHKKEDVAGAPPGPEVVLFEFVDTQTRILSMNPHAIPGVVVRANILLNIFNKIAKGYGDLRGIARVNLGDLSQEEIPALCFCTTPEKLKTNILLPGTMYYPHCPTNVRSIPFEDKNNKAFWRGCSVAGEYSTDLKNNTRIQCCEQSNMYPDLIDAKITLFTQGLSLNEETQKYYADEGHSLKIEQWLNNKYNLVIDGNTTSWGIKHKIIGRNVLVYVPRKSVYPNGFVDYNFLTLKENVHYVKTTPENLKDVVISLNKDRSFAGYLAENAREYALTYLDDNFIVDYMHEILKEYIARTQNA